METLSIKTNSQTGMLNITNQIQGFVESNNWNDGLITIFVPHTTAAITINENADPDVVRDIKRKISELIPEEDGYSHSEGNSDAHIKSSLFGPSLTLIVKDGHLLLGTWQGVYFCEFDGPRNRKFFIKY